VLLEPIFHSRFAFVARQCSRSLKVGFLTPRSFEWRYIQPLQTLGNGQLDALRTFFVLRFGTHSFSLAFRKLTAAKGTSIRQTIAREAGAILVNAPTLEGWDLLQGPAVAISSATAIYALLFSGLSRCVGDRGGICGARIGCSRTQ
jgi:hypothetical protein